MKILIVDDDFLIRGLVKEYLKKYASEFFEADSFSNASKLLFSACEFDLIILDNHLPDGLGINLIENALAKTSDIIIFTADSVEYEFREQAMQRGAKMVLSKTSSHYQLHALVAEICHERNQHNKRG